MLTYSEIQDLIPRSSRNTAEVDHVFATAVIQAVLVQLDNLTTTQSVDQLNKVLWPHDVKLLPPEELERLQWLAKRIQLIPRGTDNHVKP